VLASVGIRSLGELRTQDPHRLEVLLNRKPPFGHDILEEVSALPKYRLTINEEALTHWGGTEAVVASLKIEVGLDGPLTTPRGKKASILGFASVLTVTSDMEFIDYRRIPVRNLTEPKSFMVVARLEKPSQAIEVMVITPMDQIHPNLLTRPPSFRVAILPLPLPNSPDLTRECTKAFSKVGRSRASVSSKSWSSLGGGDKSPKSAPLGPSSLAFLHEQRSEEDGSGTAEHHYYAIGPSSGAPGLLPAEGSAQKVNDLASQSSHSSSQYYPTSAATHPPPMSYQHPPHHFYQATMPPPRPARTPSPTQHRRNSASSQTAVNKLGVAFPSSWHGHTSTPTRAGHASWHGPSLATHWPGHLPHLGGARPTDPSSSGSSNPPYHPQRAVHRRAGWVTSTRRITTRGRSPVQDQRVSARTITTTTTRAPKALLPTPVGNWVPRAEPASESTAEPARGAADDW
ncbi:Sec63, partial [Tulasnella sp. 427]